MKPILFSVSAFDATQEYEFRFSFTGDQPFSNRLVIRDNDTDDIVYDETISTMQLKHTLPAESLTNSTSAYNAQVQTFDNGDNPSTLSDRILFYCYDSPTWEFDNLVSEQTVRNASFSPILSYSQTQGELLNSYQIILYDSLQNQMYSTGTKYDTSGELTASISGLQDNQQYYLRATGETVKGMLVDTGYVLFSVDYLQPVIFDVVEVENLPQQGSVRIASNILSVIGHPNIDEESLVYVDEDEAIDLTEDGVYISFHEAFSIDTDFTMQIIGRSFNANTIIMELASKDNPLDRIVVWWKQGHIRDSVAEKAYIQLYSNFSSIIYTTISNQIDIPLDTDSINIWIRKENNLYTIVILNEDDV